MPISKTKLKTGALLLSVSFLGGCVNLTPDIVYPLGAAGPIDASFLVAPDAAVEGTIKTAKSGDVIIAQPVQSAIVYRLSNKVEPVGNISLAVQERKLELNEGDLFYAALNVGQETAKVACSLGRPALTIPRLNPGASASMKICFELEAIEGDIEPDTINKIEDDYSTDRFFYVADGYYGITEQSGPYQKLSRWDPQFIYNVSPAAELVRLEEDTETKSDAPQLALRFVMSQTEASLEPIYLVDDLPVELDDDDIIIDTEAGFPQTIKHDGASIELLALEEGVLAYRIVNGFDRSRNFIMDMPE